MPNEQRKQFTDYKGPGWLRCVGMLVIIFVLPAGGTTLASMAWAQQTQQAQQQPTQSQPPQAQGTQTSQGSQNTAQQTEPPRGTPKISVEVKVVTVYATVRDKHEKIVPDLKQEDFVLDEDGHPQTITHFIRETDVPLTLGLLVDTSLSQRRVLDQEKNASYTFLDHMLSEKDRAFVIHFDREVELLQDLTASHKKLQAALDLLQTPERDDSASGDPPQRRGAGTLLYDAVYLASDELMKKQQGRKALFILSDGVDHGSKESLEDAVESAQRADTSVYSILFADDEAYDRGGYGNRGGGWGMGHPGGMGGGWPGGGGGGGRRGGSREERPDGKKVLQRISQETGGTFFEVSKRLSINDIYTRIEEELRNQYSLGYTPTPNSSAGYHKIHLTTTKKDLTVQARDGYYSDH
jgi:VWFA-related protein